MPHSVNLSNSSQTKVSRPSSGSTSSKQAASALLPEKHADQHPPPVSHFSSNFSFGAPHQREEDDNLSEMRPVTQGATTATRKNSRSVQQFFDDSFAYKEDSTSTARDRITKDAPIVAELKTNVIVQDEYTLVTDLSHHLSSRYQRPESSIMITVHHSACLLLGGSFEPTYLLTISGLPVHVQPALNKRNAALIQNFMTESLGVMSDRGVVKFMPIPEDSLAVGGMTILGDIERLERQHAEENGIQFKRLSTRAPRKSSIFKSKSGVQLSRKDSMAVTDAMPPITSSYAVDGPLDSAVAVNERGGDEMVPHPLSRKRSEPTLTKFSHHDAPPLPALPGDKMGKHKSLLGVFRR